MSQQQERMLPMTRLLLILCLLAVCSAFKSLPVRYIHSISSRIQLNSKINENGAIESVSMISVRKIFSALSISIALLSSNSVIGNALADDGKADKAFELCLSKCVFEQTKPPPLGSPAERMEATKPRKLIIKECKVKCATTPEQLLTGKAKNRAPTAE